MIDKKKFQNQIFKTHGVMKQNNEKGLSRIQGDWKPNNSNSIDLREKVRNIVWEKSDEYKLVNKVKISDFDVIQICCSIPIDTVKKAISGKYKLTRKFLYKFTVGLKLDIELANSLFKEHSGELNITNDADYIVYYALKTKDDIGFFIDELYKYTGINLDSDKL